MSYRRDKTIPPGRTQRCEALVFIPELIRNKVRHYTERQCKRRTRYGRFCRDHDESDLPTGKYPPLGWVVP